MKRFLLIAVLLTGGANAQMFDEPSVRSACEQEASKQGIAETMRSFVIDGCVGAHRGDMVQIEYKKALLPPLVYVKCTSDPDLDRVNQCLDDAVLMLPRGSVRGIWHLQNGPAEKIFWSFADCNAERLRNEGSVCVSD